MIATDNYKKTILICIKNEKKVSKTKICICVLLFNPMYISTHVIHKYWQRVQSNSIYLVFAQAITAITCACHVVLYSSHLMKRELKCQIDTSATRRFHYHPFHSNPKISYFQVCEKRAEHTLNKETTRSILDRNKWRIRVLHLSRLVGCCSVEFRRRRDFLNLSAIIDPKISQSVCIKCPPGGQQFQQ